MEIGVIIQARMSSTRLPGKVMKSLPYSSDITILGQVITRIKRSKYINQVIVATTNDSEDSKIVELARQEQVKSFRGSRENVLERFYLSAVENELDVVVRITSDCPCIDPAIVDMVVSAHLKDKNDYTSNSLQRTFPHGLDTEVFSFEALEKAYLNATLNFEKEHVTPYIYKSFPSAFKIGCVVAPPELFDPSIRITVDTKEDYILLCAVFDFLSNNKENFGGKEIVSLFREKPWLKMINESILQKKFFQSLNEELLEAVKLLGMQELINAKKIIENVLNQQYYK